MDERTRSQRLVETLRECYAKAWLQAPYQSPASRELLLEAASEIERLYAAVLTMRVVKDKLDTIQDEVHELRRKLER